MASLLFPLRSFRHLLPPSIAYSVCSDGDISYIPRIVREKGMPCDALILGLPSCNLHLPAWNFCNIDIDAYVRAVVANDTLTNRLVVFLWASHVRRSLYVDYLDVSEAYQ